MALDVEELVDDQPKSPHGPEGEAPRRSRRKIWKVLAIVVAALVVVVAGAALLFFLGREKAAELSDEAALEDFRASGSAAADTAGRPAAGVYAATATGNESIGLPGFDEELGPNSPVTVTHDGGGCWTYRADFNSHHWRSWSFCPTDSATFALTRLESWTARKAPGLDIATLVTYTCDQPLDLLWQGASEGDTRTGACTGTSDMDDSVTLDAGEVEVLGRETVRVAGEDVDVVHLRTTDTFSRDQTGREIDEWWLDATTGLPVKLHIDAQLSGGASDYAETAELELSTSSPAT